MTKIYYNGNRMNTPLNRFKHSMKVLFKRALLIAILVGVVVGVVRLTTNDEVKPIQVNIKSELDRIQEEEVFKKETILRARQVANDRKMEQENLRHKESVKKIESEYESIRIEEIQLVEGGVSLK